MISSNESNGMVMPVAPAYGGSGGFGNTFGGDWAWILLLLLLCGNGWGNGFGGFGGGDMYPWMNQQINNLGGCTFKIGSTLVFYERRILCLQKLL